MRYKAERDIPRACKELKTISPTEIAEWVKEHRTKKLPTGKRVQWEISPQAISMWFKRNPIEYGKLKEGIIAEELDRTAVSEHLFSNGAFKKLPCIEQLIIDMRGRGAKEPSIRNVLSYIKKVCKGELPTTREMRRNKMPPKRIEDWGLKHPRRLTVDDCLKYNSEMIQEKVGDRNLRLAMRAFLKSRGMRGWDKLSGKYAGAGKYAHIYAPPPKMKDIFEWLKPISDEAHDASFFAFKTACRIGATLSAEAKYVDREAHTMFVFEKASKHGEKRKLKKWIPPDLWEVIEPRINRGGKLFHIEEGEINHILKACYKEVIPELAHYCPDHGAMEHTFEKCPDCGQRAKSEIVMWFHFLRHQFAQHGLRATGWNTSLIAKLGGWTVGTLERYYGKMDEQTAFKEAQKFLPYI